MAKIKVVVEYDLVCSNCFLPIDCIEHDSHDPPQIAVGYCSHCVEEKIKSGIESERRMMMQVLQEYFKNTNKS